MKVLIVIGVILGTALLIYILIRLIQLINYYNPKTFQNKYKKRIIDKLISNKDDIFLDGDYFKLKIDEFVIKFKLIDDAEYGEYINIINKYYSNYDEFDVGYLHIKYRKLYKIIKNYNKRQVEKKYKDKLIEMSKFFVVESRKEKLKKL